MLNDNGLRLAGERYFKDGETTWAEVADRVSTYVANGDEKLRQEVYELILNLKFLPNSPTLMNAGTRLPQLSACFFVPIEEDSMAGIFKAVQRMAEIQKMGGGTGFNFSILREKGSEVSTTKGQASGVISFSRVFNSGSMAVEQGGVRRGANMGLLDDNHPDIPEFITYKADANKQIEYLKSLTNDPAVKTLLESKKELTYFNLSISASDKFMAQVQNYVRNGVDSDWEFISRKTQDVHSTMKISELWSMIVNQAWKSGDPGMIFIDTINAHNPVPKFRINGTNPCGEQPLGDFESCNLGSINLLKFVDKNGVNYDELEKAVRIAVRFLDAVVDMNLFPLPEIEKATRANRKIGLGIMGVADALYRLGIRYGSNQAVVFSETVQAFIDDIAFLESVHLGMTKGNFPNWELSIFYNGTLDGRPTSIPMRNACRTTIAPTGSISLLAGCSSGIEPNFSLGYKRMVRETHGDGSYYMNMVNPVLVEVLQERGLYSDELIEKIVAKGGVLKDIEEIPEDMKEVFITSMDVTPLEHLLMQQAFQKHCDNAVSKTINMPSSATPADIGEAYLKAWELGLKGVTIYRDGSLDVQVLNAVKEKDEPETVPEMVAVMVEGEAVMFEKSLAEGLEKCPECGEKSLSHGSGCAICFNCGYTPCHSS